MSNWSIGRKIFFALAVSLLGLVVVAFVAYNNIAKLTKTDEWVTHTHQVLEAREQILMQLKDAETGQRGFLIVGENRYLEPYNNAVAELPRSVAHLRELTIDNAVQQQRISDLEPMIASKLAEMKETIDLRSHSGFDPARKVVATDAGKTVMDQIRSKAAEIENAERTLLASREADAARSVETTRTSLLVSAILAILISSSLVFSLVRSLQARLSQAVEALEQVAVGNLTVMLDSSSQDEVGRMAVALNQATVKLSETLLAVSDNASQASASSQQLAAASEAIASGAQEQAASLEETSASLEEITATVRQSADNARQASQLAAGSRDTAELGQTVVSDAIAAMEEINAASAQISDIISTIDEIAFQTNLLAVNAAVEAARAGEQGRGFAVVATEVRSLAQRSAAAAKEIKGLIQGSLRKVNRGSELVNKSGETLTGIVNSVKRVTDIVGEIAAAAQEQSTGVEQVNLAMTQMDQVTQSNSAQTEELSATARVLSSQALNLQTLMAAFTLTKGSPAQQMLQSREENAGHAAAGAPSRTGRVGKSVKFVHPRGGQKIHAPLAQPALATTAGSFESF